MNKRIWKHSYLIYSLMCDLIKIVKIYIHAIMGMCGVMEGKIPV